MVAAVRRLARSAAVTNYTQPGTTPAQSDPHNLSYPCHPQHRLLVDEERVTTRRDLRVECPSCEQSYRVRLYQFEHPLTVMSVFEWTAYIAHILRVFPVPPALLVRAYAPLWSDLTFGAEPEMPTPFVSHPTTGLFGPATVDDLRASGRQAVMADQRLQAGDWESLGRALAAAHRHGAAGQRVRPPGRRHRPCPDGHSVDQRRTRSRFGSLSPTRTRCSHAPLVRLREPAPDCGGPAMTGGATMSTDTLTRRDIVTKPQTGSGNPIMAHICPKAGITEAYVFGTPLTALCGYTFVPSRDPKPLPLCAECKEISDRLWGQDLTPE
jgi:Protein of unknown function (DUF3039)